MRPGGEAGSLSLSLSGRTREAAICNAHNFARRAHGRCEATAKFQFPIVGRGRQPLAIMAIVIRFRISFPAAPLSLFRGVTSCYSPTGRAQPIPGTSGFILSAMGR